MANGSLLMVISGNLLTLSVKELPNRKVGLFYSMRITDVLYLMSADAHVYKVIWENLYYGERTIKECSSMYINSSNLLYDLMVN